MMMKFFNLKDLRTPAKILWYVMLVGSVTVSVVALAMATQFPFYKITVLLSAIFISVLLSQYELRLPKTQIEVSVGNVIAIWGVFWLGLSGGVLLGAAASSSKLFRERKLTSTGIFNSCLTILSISGAATVFSVLYPVTVDSGSGWSALRDRSMIISGTVLMTAVIFIIFNTLDLAFRLFDGTMLRRFGSNFLRRSVEVLPIIGTTVVLCLMFAQFGISFGLVVVPIAVFAILAYRIHLKRLEQKTTQILEASRVHLATVEALATAIDARDQIGHGHVRRTQIYAVGLGEILGLGADEINALRTGALLHDIGKLAVPDNILSKPGALTPAEIEKAKIHASVGASILESVGFGYPVVPTVKYHHEFWNGKGYPEGLCGEEIPFTARILAIADNYDTLRSDRPYRRAMTRDKARDILANGAGTQFDPTLIGVFLKRLSSLEAEIERQGLYYDSDKIGTSNTTENEGHHYVDQIKLANKEVFTLFELAREFGGSENPAEILAMFTSRIGELVPFDTCAVYLLDNTRRAASAVHVEGENKDAFESSVVKAGTGASGMALKTKNVIKNVNPDLDFSMAQLDLINPYSTMVSIPLLDEDELIGAVSLYSYDLAEYGEEHIRLLESVSRIAAEAIAKSQQHAETVAHALTDPMTGLPNARSLQAHFEKEMGRAARADQNLQVLVMDLDGFKAVNDTFGHIAGDEVLREVGRVITEQLRDYDFLARYGGDEYVAIIPDADQEAVVDLCARIEKAVTELKVPVEGDAFARVGVSLGSASYPHNGQTFDQIIVAADKAMYIRKSTRKLRERNIISSSAFPAGELLTYENGLLQKAKVETNSGSDDGFIVELDESHVVVTASVN